MANDHSGHRERLRQQFIKSSPGLMHPHQLLELLLFYAIPLRDTNPIAHALLNRFRTLDRVFDATVEELTEVKGIGPKAAELIKAVSEVYALYGRTEHSRRLLINGPFVADAYYNELFLKENGEQIAITLLDSELSILYSEKAEVKKDWSDEAVALLLKTVSDTGCAHFAAAHYLPQISTPDDADKAAAERLCAAAESAGAAVRQLYILSGGELFEVNI